MNVVLRPFPLISLCSGGGMLDRGVHAAMVGAGFAPRTVCYVERDAHAAAALVARMADAALDQAPVWSDVGTLDCRPWRGRVRGVVAGIPCQGNSLAGKRLLGDDPRNLWPTTRRILRDLDCDFFFLENVGGFLVPDRKLGREAPVRRVLGELAEDGWDAEWDVVSARDVGANHRRDRVFLLAHRRRNDRSRIAGVLGAIPSRQGDEGTEPSHGGDQAGRSDAAGGRDGVPASTALGVPLGVGDSEGGGCEGERAGGVGESDLPAGQAVPRRAGGGLPTFAPARNDYAGWVRVLGTDPSLVPAVRRADRGGLPGGTEVAQSAVRGVPYGVAGRMVGDPRARADELRLCGNGVVWQSAALAYAALWARMFGGEDHG